MLTYNNEKYIIDNERITTNIIFFYCNATTHVILTISTIAITDCNTIND